MCESKKLKEWKLMEGFLLNKNCEWLLGDSRPLMFGEMRI